MFWVIAFIISICYIAGCSSVFNEPLRKVELIKSVRFGKGTNGRDKFVDGTDRPIGYPEVY